MAPCFAYSKCILCCQINFRDNFRPSSISWPSFIKVQGTTPHLLMRRSGRYPVCLYRMRCKLTQMMLMPSWRQSKDGFQLFNWHLKWVFTGCFTIPADHESIESIHISIDHSNCPLDWWVSTQHRDGHGELMNKWDKLPIVLLEVYFPNWGLPKVALSTLAYN